MAGPSCFDKVKFGAMIGFAVGVSTGAIFGTYTGLGMLYDNYAVFNLWICHN